MLAKIVLGQDAPRNPRLLPHPTACGYTMDG